MIKKIYVAVLSLSLLASCNYLDVEPAGKVIPDELSEFRALMTSAYSKFPTHKKMLTVRGDEIFPALFTPTYDGYIDLALMNDVNPDPVTPVYPWTRMYNVIFYANTVIHGVADAHADSRDESAEQLRAEALLLRAYSHFELLNLYRKPYDAATASSDKGVPLSLKTDIEQEFIPASIEEVYGQILADIREARELMQTEEQPASLRYRFSGRSAKALEARVRLYRGEWDEALKVAEELLPSCPLVDMNTDETLPYDYRSKEMILALELTGGTDLTDDMDVLPNLLGKYNVDEDLRVAKYFRMSSYGGCFPNKCYDKSMKVTFRSGEIYLIAAEAAAHLPGGQEKAREYLRQLMVNRLKPGYYAQKAAALNGMDQQQLIAEIADERARELALEGHRWYDLRRTTRPELVISYMDKNYEPQELVIRENDSRYVIPFPQEAIQNNPNLAD